LLAETISLLNLVLHTNDGVDTPKAWSEISFSLAKQERNLLPLSDMSTTYERAYEALVYARVASQRQDAPQVIEALQEAIESLKPNTTKLAQ
jgi:hypothetical protein